MPCKQCEIKFKDEWQIYDLRCSAAGLRVPKWVIRDPWALDEAALNLSSPTWPPAE